MARLSLLPAVLTYALAVVAVLTNTTHHGTKRACSAIWDTATVRSVPTWISLPYPDLPPRPQSVATKLQVTHFNSYLGYYRGNIIWTDAVSYLLRCATVCVEFNVAHFQNTIEDIYNLMSLKNFTTWRDLIYQTQIGQMGLAHLNLWDFFFNGSFDDAGVGRHLNANDRRGPNDGRLTHTVDAALAYPHPRFHRIERWELR